MSSWDAHISTTKSRCSPGGRGATAQYFNIVGLEWALSITWVFEPLWWWAQYEREKRRGRERWKSHRKPESFSSTEQKMRKYNVLQQHRGIWVGGGNEASQLQGHNRKIHRAKDVNTQGRKSDWKVLKRPWKRRAKGRSTTDKYKPML